MKAGLTRPTKSAATAESAAGHYVASRDKRSIRRGLVASARCSTAAARGRSLQSKTPAGHSIGLRRHRRSGERQRIHGLLTFQRMLAQLGSPCTAPRECRSESHLHLHDTAEKHPSKRSECAAVQDIAQSTA